MKKLTKTQRTREELFHDEVAFLYNQCGWTLEQLARAMKYHQVGEVAEAVLRPRTTQTSTWRRHEIAAIVTGLKTPIPVAVPDPIVERFTTPRPLRFEWPGAVPEELVLRRLTATAVRERCRGNETALVEVASADLRTDIFKALGWPEHLANAGPVTKNPLMRRMNSVWQDWRMFGWVTAGCGECQPTPCFIAEYDKFQALGQLQCYLNHMVAICNKWDKQVSAKDKALLKDSREQWARSFKFIPSGASTSVEVQA